MRIVTYQGVAQQSNISIVSRNKCWIVSRIKTFLQTGKCRCIVVGRVSYSFVFRSRYKARDKSLEKNWSLFVGISLKNRAIL